MNATSRKRHTLHSILLMVCLSFFTCLLMITMFIGCAANNANFKMAKSQYEEAAASSEIMANSPAHMQEAKKNLDLAADKHDDTDQSHYSYLATKHVEIARAESNRKSAESALVDQRTSRNHELLSARTREADAAHKATKLANQRTQDAEDRAATSKTEADAARASASDMAARNKELRKDLTDLQSRETNRGLEITLQGTYFEVEKSDLKAGAMHNLDLVAKAMRNYPGQEAIIEGFTDNTGTDDFNQELSQQRANSVSNYLIKQGVQSSRLIAQGYGEKYPSVSNDTSSGRQQNRRVDIVLLNKGQKAQDSLRK